MTENSGFVFTLVSLVLILVTFCAVVGAGTLFLCNSKYAKFIRVKKKTEEKSKMSADEGWNGF